jgi:hypothetical protein
MSASALRSVFDQYSQLENRLTNGLIQVLARDQRLARAFVLTATGTEIQPKTELSFTCQTKPGEVQPVFATEGDPSVPDAWIYQGDQSWTLLVESKVTDTLTHIQLSGHVKTAQNRGFKAIRVLAITADERVPPWLQELSSAQPMHWIGWPNVFDFLSTSNAYSSPVARFLAQEFLDYLRIVEARLVDQQKVLTTFTGIPFDSSHPFNEPEARVILRALMQKLRPALTASATLPIAKVQPQKPLTGPWDLVLFSFSGTEQNFTLHPHLSVGLIDGEAMMELIIPNAAKGPYWQRLRRATTDGSFAETLTRVVNRSPKRKYVQSVKVWEPRLALYVGQRHFPTRAGEGVIDGQLFFDLDTLHGNPRVRVRRVHGWLRALETVLESKSLANFQVELQARFPYGQDSVTHSAGFINHLVRAAEAFTPLLDLLRGQDDI